MFLSSFINLNLTNLLLMANNKISYCCLLNCKAHNILIIKKIIDELNSSEIEKVN
jgi:hypothetical protein